MSNPDIQYDLVGGSRPMAEVICFIERAARSSLTVLIQGESGTGKELVARALHRSGPRSAGRFVAVNCGALPESLVESELFGHEKGAFTGAVAQKKGRIELASGGTLFLDEVDALSLSVQTKLLRVLQEHEIDRIGGTVPVAIDVRFIAATNKDLKAAIAHGHFREDLYYRLNCLPVTLPPLRERRKDIPPLIRHFIARHQNAGERTVRGVSARAAAVLRRYDWPGNVRQLENVIGQAIALGSTELIQLGDLPRDLFANSLKRSTIQAKTLEEAVLETERQYVENAVEIANGDPQKAAAILGIHPKSMRRFLDRLKLSHLL